MKKSRYIYGILKKNSKLYIETLPQKQKVKKTFSPSHDIVEYVDSDGKLIEEQDSSLKAWTVVGIVSRCSFSNEKVEKSNFSKE